MKRIILDTNIYGELIFDKEYTNLKDAIPKKLTVYGFRVIRDELRDIPKKIKVEGSNFRIAILHIYDEITQDRSFPMTEEMQDLAELYFSSYKDFGGVQSRDHIKDDFLIVACASIKGMDIVASEDNKTLLSENAQKAYKLMNASQKLKTPEFIGYLEFKRWLIG